MLRERTAADPERMRRALEGLRKYQEAERPPPAEPKPAIAERLGATLRDYGGTGPATLFVPSLINPPNVLDLGGRSLLRWLAGRGHRVLLLDWGWPGPERYDLSVAGHVEQILLPLLGEMGEPAALAGYCLGGTMAAAAAERASVRGLALVAAPWHFSGFPEAPRARLAALWAGAREPAGRLGVLPMEALQSAFWSIDTERTIAKFEAFAEMEGEAARRFIALEDWANDGPPLPAAAARELFEDFFATDLPGTGAWTVAGMPADPARLTIPVLNVISRTDRIVPAASAPAIGERLELREGHVGMIVGSGARQSLWQPLSEWLSGTAGG